MAIQYEPHVRPLYSLTDEEVNAVVSLYSSYIFSMNSRKLVNIETWYNEDGDDAKLNFRLTTITESDPPEKFTSAFHLSFRNGDQSDLYFSPITDQNYYPEWLAIYGITETFVYHQVGINEAYQFFKNKLQLWNRDANIVYIKPVDERGSSIPWKQIPVTEDSDG